MAVAGAAQGRYMEAGLSLAEKPRRRAGGQKWRQALAVLALYPEFSHSISGQCMAPEKLNMVFSLIRSYILYSFLRRRAMHSTYNPGQHDACPFTFPASTVLAYHALCLA